MAVNQSRSRGLSVWPFILIGVGVVWLLTQIGIFTGAHLSVLFRLWPVILIAVGVSLLVGRGSRAVSTLLGFATLALLVGLMFVGPSIGLATDADIHSDQFSVPLESARSAQVEIQASVGNLTVGPLGDAATLFDADISYLGQVTLDTSDNDGQRRVVLSNDYRNNGLEWISLLPFVGGDTLAWRVGLNDAVPLDLTIATGTAAADLNLGALQLNSLHVNTGTGSVTLSLPAQADRYAVMLNTGTGSVDIDVPDGVAVRLTGTTGTGRLDVPSWLPRVSGEERNFIGDEGVWETPGFAGADRQIVIQFTGGTGSLRIH